MHLSLSIYIYIYIYITVYPHYKFICHVLALGSKMCLQLRLILNKDIHIIL